MKTSGDFIEAINALEREIPVTAWRSGDIDLWPSYRLRLYGDLVEDMLASPGPNAMQPRWRQLLGRAARASFRVPLAAWSDRRANAPVLPGTAAVFLSDGVSFTQLGGVWLDRVVDPVIEALEARGHRCLKLTPMAQAHVPRHLPSRFVQPALDRVKLLAPLRPAPLSVPGFEACETLARTRFGFDVPGIAWLQVQAARLEALARWFAGPIARSGARFAFVNTWYSLEGQAFVLAARRLGLRTIDLQHGVQGNQHAAYVRWIGAAPAGLSTLPDEFWVWGEPEAQAIAEWSAASTRHRPRITGNYWLQQWRDDSQPLIARYLGAADALRAGAATQVLVGLVWGVADEETDKLIEAARLCGPSVAWWWRLHPVEAHRRDRLIARLEACGLDSSSVGPATDLPLYALVRRADLVVSHSSTVIQEAAEFDLPSVVTSDYGAALFPGLIENGTVLQANEPAAIAAAVMALARRPRARTSPAVDQASLLGAAVDSLLRCAPPRQPPNATP